MAISLNDSERRTLRGKARKAVLDALRALGGDVRREMILERALADGGFSARELAAPSPEAAGERYSRLVDHDLSWALTNLKRDGLVENPKWGIWRLSSAALLPVEAAVQEDIPAERLAELRELPYRLYLRTPEWRRTRAAALLRADNACSLDVTHIESLEVHHRTYERLGAELVTDLLVLCHECHMLHHKEHGRPARQRSAEARPPLSIAGASSSRLGAHQRGEPTT